jgi:hypothetical protein
MNSEFSEKRNRSLEDMFFYEQDRRLIEQRKKLQKMQETKENLAKISGIQDDAVLEKLVALDIRPETLATLIGIPLIEIAWADGEMDEKERKKLFEYAENSGLRKKGLDPKVMSIWLQNKPDPALLEAWTQYMRTLSRQLTDAERKSFREELMADARSVAKAAGGILGYGTISSEEKAMLSKLESAFQT